MKKKMFWMSCAILCFVACKQSTPSTEGVPMQTAVAEEAVVEESNDTSAFVTLTDVVPDAILEIRYFGTYNFVGTRIDGYLEPTALMTREAADSLRAVSDDVKELGYRLKIYDAYRPMMAVKHFIFWAIEDEDIRMKPYFYPDIDKQDAFQLGYIAKRSSHSRGSAVDLTLLDMKTGKEVDMGGPFDLFGERSHPDFSGITDEQYANRMLLRAAMERNGFEPYECEWWHFRLADEPFPDTYFNFPVAQASVKVM